MNFRDDLNDFIHKVPEKRMGTLEEEARISWDTLFDHKLIKLDIEALTEDMKNIENWEGDDL